MRFGISESDLSKILDEIIKHLGTTSHPRVYIFGSRAKGSFRQFSDIDLLLTADTFDNKSLSNIDFSELDIPYKVDFVLDSDLFEAYREDIENHMISIWPQ